MECNVDGCLMTNMLLQSLSNTCPSLNLLYIKVVMTVFEDLFKAVNNVTAGVCHCGSLPFNCGPFTPPSWLLRKKRKKSI